MVAGATSVDPAQRLRHEEHMANYPQLLYPMNVVRKAGKFLRQPIIIDDDFGPDQKAAVIEAFTIANSFRDSHVYPMRSIKLTVMRRMRMLGVTGLTASRPKRMTSIRRKLAEGSNNLDQINDLGGCRIITDDHAGVRAILESIHQDSKHRIRREYNYIDEPKVDGYRSHHVVFDYVGSGKTAMYDGRRIELQIRTRLQHAWATAVEAMGLFRDEDLKHGEGDPDWLRLFALVSAEFSHVESCPVHPAMPPRLDRIPEIRDLNANLKATGVLDDLRMLTNYAENSIYGDQRFFLIRYGKDHQVRVEGYHSAELGANTLRGLEEQIVVGENESKVVLVEVDRIEKLYETYPSYFGDVSLFVDNLRRICEGRDAIEYSLVPQERVSVSRPPPGDPSQLRRRYNQWDDAITKASKR